MQPECAPVAHFGMGFHRCRVPIHRAFVMSGLPITSTFSGNRCAPAPTRSQKTKDGNVWSIRITA